MWWVILDKDGTGGHVCNWPDTEKMPAGASAHLLPDHPTPPALSDVEEIIDRANSLRFMDMGAAFRMYEEALRLEPGSERAYCGKALALMLARRHKDAAACMRDLLRVLPGAAYAHGLLGACVEQEGMKREALACYERMLELEPGDVAARFRKECVRGVIDSEGGQIGMLKAVLFETDDPAAIKTQQVIRSILFRGKHPKISDKEVAVVTPGMMRMCDILFKRGGKRGFLDMLYPDKGPAPDDESSDDMLDRAAKLADIGLTADALELVDAAMVRDPGLAEAHSFKATYLARLGRHWEAAGCMGEFLQRRPGDANALCARGMMLEKAGRPAEAAACYEIWIKAEPGHMPARHLMCGLLAASGDADGLAECYRAALEAEPDGENDADTQENMRAEYDKLERCARDTGSMNEGFAKFMNEMGVGMETMWGRGYGGDARPSPAFGSLDTSAAVRGRGHGRDARRAGRARSKGRVRAGRRR